MNDCTGSDRWPEKQRDLSQNWPDFSIGRPDIVQIARELEGEPANVLKFLEGGRRLIVKTMDGAIEPIRFEANFCLQARANAAALIVE